jgi:hypothetical protein
MLLTLKQGPATVETGVFHPERGQVDQGSLPKAGSSVSLRTVTARVTGSQAASGLESLT